MTTATINPAAALEAPNHAYTRPLRIAIICDYLEENWPSMDLVGNMLHSTLTDQHGDSCLSELVRPTLPFKTNSRSSSATRFFGRFIHYPRELRRLRTEFDLFHIVDHSYAHLVHELPPERTIVTCHDVDTFRCLLSSSDRHSFAFRMMTRRILSGLRKAAHITCDTAATRRGLLHHGLLSSEQTSVVHNGVRPALSPFPDNEADSRLAQILRREAYAVPELLHVGSTIPRKRIDILLETFARVLLKYPEARLLRVGGDFTPAQQRLARDLRISHAIDVLPRLSDCLLASVYRRSALLLQTSEAEGFGLPVVEAMACGTPVVASDIASLREVGGTAAAYCTVGDIAQFANESLRLLDERNSSSPDWVALRAECLNQSRQFTWANYAAAMVKIYKQVIQ